MGIRKGCILSKNIKMIVTDLDGTLLKDDKTISNFTLHIIDKFRKKGNLFVIATARPFRAAKKYMESIGFDAGIYHNGALIYDKNIKVSDYGIENPCIIMSNILKWFPDSCLAVEAEDMLYANFNSERLWPGNGYIYTDNFKELKEKTADKIIVEVSSRDDLGKFNKIIPKELYIQLSENKMGMIMNKKTTKFNGIQLLSERYQINIDDIISFGDDFNDIDMIKGCGRGIAVENALIDVKAIASGICKSNQEDGVANWIKDNIL